jgi:hypothetical protein
MLRNLEPFVNAVEDTFGYPDGLVATPSLFGWGLEYQDTRLILELAPDGLDVQVPEFGNFGRRIMALGRTRRSHRNLRMDR